MDIILLFKLKFMDKVLSEWENPDSKQPKTLKNIINAEMIQTKILPEVKKLFSELLVQDDEARIHRTRHVLDTVDATFPQRIPAKMASCMVDLLPIENIWAIIKQELPKYGKMENITRLKRAIKTIWGKIHADKAMLQRMMRSCCERCKACIRLEGSQVHKEDYHVK